MAYDDKTVYAKYLKGKLSSSSGCSGCAESSSAETDCDCCPPGLISYKDNGVHVGCLTPNDAQEYAANSVKTCNDGYVALYKEGVTPEFRGCVSEDTYADLYAILNPVAP